MTHNTHHNNPLLTQKKMPLNLKRKIEDETDNEAMLKQILIFLK